MFGKRFFTALRSILHRLQRRRRRGVVSLHNINDDCLQIIFDFLDRSDLAALSRVSQRFHDPCYRIIYSHWKSTYPYPLLEMYRDSRAPRHVLKFIVYVTSILARRAIILTIV